MTLSINHERPCGFQLPADDRVAVRETRLRRLIVAADQASELFGNHGTDCQHGTPAGGPAVDPDDITPAS
jgi:hypothetical protein